MKNVSCKTNMTLSDLERFNTIVCFYDKTGNIIMVLVKEDRRGWKIKVKKDGCTGHPLFRVVSIEQSPGGRRLRVFESLCQV